MVEMRVRSVPNIKPGFCEVTSQRLPIPIKSTSSTSDFMKVITLWGTSHWSDLACAHTWEHFHFATFSGAQLQENQPFTKARDQPLVPGGAGFKFYLCGLPVPTVHSVSFCLKLDSLSRDIRRESLSY